MNKFSSQEIVSLFDILNNNNIEYLLLRNINRKLPNDLPRNDDIDIIVNIQYKDILFRILKSNGWKRITHPHSKVPFLYSMQAFDFYDLKGLHVDVCYELACRSLVSREWIPLDQRIQDDVWKNKRKVSKLPWNWELSYELEVVHLLTRCIFDKKRFESGYVQRIKDVLLLCDRVLLAVYLEVVFFKFRDTLTELLDEEQYDLIIERYLTFIDY